ncbi:DUF4442 domain-containing protein [Psychrobacter sp. UBA3962]|uniref:DUF4442 domain-containing protein n=1 Tax=Psychrobacter sp. UBA3962 TaxID=1947352 RepID=UPI0025FC5A9A|nr:DUF4442 domain-containing protein [Psychrobacter sp. UBA3962]
MSQLSNLIQQVSSTKKVVAEKAATIATQLNLPSKTTQPKNETTDQDAFNSAQPKAINNPFTKILKAVQLLPKSTQSFVLTKAFSKIVPYVGTTGIVYEEVSPNKLVVSLENKKAVQNHIGSVHAVAVTLLAETATGFVLAVNLPSDRILLVKSYEVNFYRPVKKGQIAAIATLSDEQRQYILDTPKGEMVIPCVIEDRNSDSDRAPITVDMTWAWIPKSELKQRREGKSKEIKTK